ncbi:hypothetical protein HQ45_06665 [Porphyromonas crevioricanis]|uniref:Type I secretion outer membrane protein, TolC family n=1 Tax=Porphyromonas crevioricanis TaxID=393921 RepID=A0AB34PGU3_9PORP|nr:TolC family protein [Porphyromonas crevioricanis]KGN89672.1 hypothetical protein HQ45_06665 [Porphyromonas crevioricanis]KGN93773.1 hypothetical protein HQ38_08355 [Porphyromonas crevioricanis]
MKKRKWLVVGTTTALWAMLCLSMEAQTAFTLDSCYRLARDRNREIAIAKHEIEAAKYKEKEVSVNFFPQVSLYGAAVSFGDDLQPINYDKLLGPLSPFVPPFIKNKTKIGMSDLRFGAVSAVQPLFMGGKIVAGRRMANEATKLKQSTLEMKERDVYDAVDEAYWQVVGLSSKLRLGKAYLKLIKDASADVHILVEQGIATKADALSVRVKQSEAEVMLTRIENGLQLSRMLLAQRCGLDPENPIYTTDEQNGALADGLELYRSAEDTDIASVVENRAEVRSLKTAEKIFSLERRMVLADMLPHIALVGGYSVSSPNYWSNPDRVFGGTYHIGLALTMPLTGLVSGTFKYGNANERLLIRKLETDDARTKINLQINQTRLNLTQAHKQLKKAQDNADNSKENLRMATIGYKEGVIPVINLTQAQTAWIQAEDALIEAQIGVRVAYTKYQRAIGVMPMEN